MTGQRNAYRRNQIANNIIIIVGIVLISLYLVWRF
jgi:hypothetical protein